MCGGEKFVFINQYLLSVLTSCTELGLWGFKREVIGLAFFSVKKGEFCALSLTRPFGHIFSPYFKIIQLNFFQLLLLLKGKMKTIRVKCFSVSIMCFVPFSKTPTRDQKSYQASERNRRCLSIRHLSQSQIILISNLMGQKAKQRT